MAEPRWLVLDGAVNARVARGRLLRSDNLQDLTPADVEQLVGRLRVETVVDLRTPEEVAGEGPTRLAQRTRHHSLHPESGGATDVDAPVSGGWEALGDPQDADEPPVVAAYLGYLRRRPDSVLAAVRAIAGAGDGAVLVHCAAGMDRTGVVVAVALDAVGVPHPEIVADYAATAQRIEAIFARLVASPTYAEELEGIDPRALTPSAATMERFLAVLAERHGGGGGWLAEQGLSGAELADLRAVLGA